MDDKERRALKLEVDRHRRWYDLGSRLWSTAHHGSLFLAAALSAAAALILKLDSLAEWSGRTDLAATVSALAALLGTLAASGGFQRKWRANRQGRGKLDQLLIDLSADGADATKARAELKEIIAHEDQAVLGLE
jgi:hypothetical protein